MMISWFGENSIALLACVLCLICLVAAVQVVVNRRRKPAMSFGLSDASPACDAVTKEYIDSHSAQTNVFEGTKDGVK